MSKDDDSEVIIAQEQSALSKPLHAGPFKKNEGTLILTNKRLIFASGDERKTSLIHNLSGENLGHEIEDEISNIELRAEGLGGPLYYSEIEDLNKITEAPENLFIPLSDITSVSGQKEHLLEKPGLKVSWRIAGSDEVRSTEFLEGLTGGSRKKNLNDWAPIIEQLKDGTLEIHKLPSPPSIDTLEGKIAYMMRDMQEKGPAEIEQQVEEAYKVQLDTVVVEEACQKLVSLGYLEKIPDAAEPFYRKRSPIGINGLSS